MYLRTGEKESRGFVLARISEHMEFAYLDALRENNASWRLLAAPQASFILAFFYRIFVSEGRRSISEPELIASLEDYIDQTGIGKKEIFVRPAKGYLEVWADASHSWLRRFYYRNEPHYDLTAAAQKAVEWLYQLKPRSFVGTESRLRTVFDLVRQIAEETDTDIQIRLQFLEEEKARIEEKITQLKQGHIEILDEVQIKERYLQAAVMAQDILADFREVEENFRNLERRMIEKIVTWTHGKGELLEEIFAERDGINQSEQGRSFSSFWRYLMLSSQQESFEGNLKKVLRIDAIKDLSTDIDLNKIHLDWLQAAMHVQDTVALLSKQLRRYVDENYLEEERRIFALIQDVQIKAVELNPQPPKGIFSEIDAISPEFILPMDRKLFHVPTQRNFKNEVLKDGEAEESVDALFQQVSIDREVLKKNIDTLLQEKEHVSLVEVIEAYPLKYGLTELLNYMVLASRLSLSSFDGKKEEQIIFETEDAQKMMVKLDKISFGREKKEAKK